MKSRIVKTMGKLRILHAHLEEKQDERGAGMTLEVIHELRGIINLIAEKIPPAEKSPDSQYQPKEDYENPPVDYTHIPWKQPMKRKAPVWEHEIYCNYCKSHVTVTSHSPRTPPHCRKKQCEAQHTREEAKKRKQNERKRKREARDKKK